MFNHSQAKIFAGAAGSREVSFGIHKINQRDQGMIDGERRITLFCYINGLFVVMYRRVLCPHWLGLFCLTLP